MRVVRVNWYYLRLGSLFNDGGGDDGIHRLGLC